MATEHTTDGLAMIKSAPKLFALALSGFIAGTVFYTASLPETIPQAAQESQIVATTPINDYPPRLANAQQDSIVDLWGMDNRECVSYTAWKVATTYHNMPDWHNQGADAAWWPYLAKRSGILNGSIPRAKSVAIAMPGIALGGDLTGLTVDEHGHAMWVEKVNNDGTILVSQYNAVPGKWSTATIPSDNLIYIYFQGGETV